ncbi:MAG: electron transport complex subunit RsxC [Candidatus Porifericomitaceae bacterium WSBS_2022_MAG_OTU9]
MRVVASGFSGGLLLPETKSRSNVSDAPLVPLPQRLILPLQQHIGLPAKPLVAIGDKVLKGQKIADSDGYVSVPLHSSSSGTVVDIGMYPVSRPWLHDAMCIVVEPDGEDRWCELQPVEDYNHISPERLQQVIRDSGIVGLGGAGFPAHVKLHEGVVNSVDTLIINGAECEPFISCDDRLIREKASYVVSGTSMIARVVGAKHSIIALEESMPEAAATLQQHLTDDIELVMVESRYPAGGERQLISTLTGREVPSGGLAIHIGIVMHNVATAAAVFRAVSRGEPVVSRYLTVTGAVSNPGNLQVLLGTPVEDCVKICDNTETGIDDYSKRIIVGGPMMGTRIDEAKVPVTKTVNCVLVLENSPPAVPQPCIQCGECIKVCPVGLLPQLLHKAALDDDMGLLRENHIFDCIECGCCSYVCPSSIPLVEQYRHAKAFIANYERSREGVDHARKRFLGREERMLEEAGKHQRLDDIKDDERRQAVDDILKRNQPK